MLCHALSRHQGCIKASPSILSGELMEVLLPRAVQVDFSMEGILEGWELEGGRRWWGAGGRGFPEETICAKETVNAPCVKSTMNSLVCQTVLGELGGGVMSLGK